MAAAPTQALPGRRLRTPLEMPRGTCGLVLVAAPAIVIGVMIAVFAVNTPFWDEWDMVPVLSHLHAGRFVWADFWKQHNEHRIVFPTLLLAGLAQLDSWNIVVECLCSLVIAGMSFCLLAGTAIRTRIASTGLLLAASLIWFSPAQWENWLWGWDIEWFMNVLGVTIVVFSLSRLVGGQLGAAALAALIGGGALAQFSLGNGTLIWPIAIAALVLMRAQLRQVLTVAVAAALAIGANYWHYSNPDKHSLSYLVEHLGAYVHYVLNYLGSPLLDSKAGLGVALIGAVILGVFVAANTFLLVRNREAFVRILPWTALGLYAVGSAVLTGLARVDLGPTQALSSRYATLSSLLLVATAPSLLAVRGTLLQTGNTAGAQTVRMILAAGMALVLVNWAPALWRAHHRHDTQVAVASCTRASSPSPSCLLSTYPDLSLVTQRLRFLKTMHWAGY